MSIASRIQEIETHIEDVYDTINYSYDTTGVNKNIINIPKYLKKGYIDIINNGIDTLYNNFPKVSEIGSNLSLTPTYEAPMKLNEIQGDTLQENTPTPDTPVPIECVTGLQNVDITGKNLFDKNLLSSTWSSQVVNMITLNVEPNTKYTMSSNIPYGGTVADLFLYDESGTGSTATNGVKDGKNVTVTSSSTGIIKVGYRSNLGTTVTRDDYWYQIEKGSTATSYEPYKSNTYEVNLGKNLLNYSTLNYGYVNNIGTVTPVHEQGEMYSEFIKVQPNTTYTFKIFETGSAYDNWIGIGEYTANNLSSFIQRITMTTATQNYYTFTTSATTQYIVASARNLENATKVQLEKGSQATSYSPYFTPIELNKIGTYQDKIYKDNGKWYVEKQIGKVVLDGSETYTSGSTNTSGVYRIRTTAIASLIKTPSSAGVNGNAVSNYFGITTANQNYQCVQGFAVETSGALVFYDSSGNTQTTSVFTTWLSTHNTEVLYVLKTPTYTEITNTELIEDLETIYTAKSQEGTTNISITSEDLEMILNVSALKGEE